MPPSRLDSNGQRSAAQRIQDAHEAVLDRQAVVSTARIDPARPHDLHLVEGPPKVSIHDRLAAESERVREFLVADSDVIAGSVSAAWTHKDGSTDTIYLGLPDV